MTNNYYRQILSLKDDELEQFVRDWIGKKTSIYFEVTRFSGSGDLGRDVVGFLSKKRHEGEWHNYQCKQYKQKLPTETAFHEIGKILYYAYKGKFSIPTQYFFVAPGGVNRKLEELIYNPDQFKSKLINEWDKYCSTSIIKGSSIDLDSSLEFFINSFDFSTIKRISLDDILLDDKIGPVLHKWFDADLEEAPCGITPAEVQDSELPYIKQLVGTYSERCQQHFTDYREVEKHPVYSSHMSLQRERFYEADAFKRFYRDNTEKSVLDRFENDIFYGIIDTYNAIHDDSLARVDAVMIQASNLQTAGPLAKHAHVPVRQGVCHHFVNDGRKLKWYL